MAALQPVARPESADAQLVALKVPPHSIEAEQALLGALLINNQAFDRVADLVVGEDFYRDDHRRIWRHIVKLIDGSSPADVVTIAESIDASEDKDKTGGAGYVGALEQNTPSSINVRRCDELVRERSVQRRLAQVATEIAESALALAGKEVGQLLDEAESKIFQIAESGTRKDQGLLGIKPVLARVFEKIDHLHSQANPSDVTGVPTGYLKLDEMTSGLQGGDPAHRDLGNLPLAEGHGQGAGRPGDRSLAAQPRARAETEQAAADGRPARVGRDRAGCRPHFGDLSRRGVQPGVA